MSPIATSATTNGDSSPSPQHRVPLQLTGILDDIPFEEITPVIGREYTTLDVRDLLKDPQSDAKLRELAIITSRRGVVALRNQSVTPQEQQELTARLSLLSGTPEESGLHIHPVLNGQRDKAYRATGPNGEASADDTISVISSNFRKKTDDRLAQIQGGAAGEIHSDITFEPYPSDFSTLNIHTNVDCGGDTVFYSGYEAYDRLSPAFARFLEGLEGRYAQPAFQRMAKEGGFQVHAGPRGHAANVGGDLSATHPVIRTHPVTGWKSLFAVGAHFESFPSLRPDESTLLRAYLLDQVATTHAAQARVKWQDTSEGKSTLVVFDNRCVFHAATPDYFSKGGHRVGTRVVSVGEKPYFDAGSISRRDELGGERYI